jgi:hypothetical protein
MKYHRDYTPATYGADFTHNLRWRYRSSYGEGSPPEPYRSGGSFGRGYGRTGYLGTHAPSAPYGAEYARRRRFRRPGTAARDYDRAYPYFGSAAMVEGVQGYPPGDSLTPESYPREPGPARGQYGEDFR